MDELLNKMEFFLSEKVKDIKKLWIYQNRIIVLDIEINNNRIAFDITPDINAKNVKVELFCRNTSEYLSDFEKEAISFSKNRYLIFQDSIKFIHYLKEVVFFYNIDKRMSKKYEKNMKEIKK